jgi:undecaprenyl-diphosphatase
VNYRIFSAVNGWSGNGVLDGLMKIAAKDLIFLAMLLVGALGIRAWRRRAWMQLAGAATTLAGAFLLGLAAAAVHPEVRPFQRHHVHLVLSHAPGQSFPSDHATAAFALAFAAALFLSRRWGLVLFGVAALIGFARVYDGVHYPGDILGSLVVAATAALLAASAVARPRPAAD